MCKHTVCLIETTLADNVTWTVDILEWNDDGAVTFRGVQYVDDLHSVKVDHHASTTCMYIHMCPQSMNHISLNKKADLVVVMQGHPLCRTCLTNTRPH